MCMVYNGISYPYGFEIKVPLEGSERTFNIGISRYRDEEGCFTGLCLENELTVTSNSKVQFLAFYEIINKIIDITLEGEKLYAKLNNGRKSSPMVSVEDPEVLNVFEKVKNSTKSLEYYKKLMDQINSSPEYLLEEGVSEEEKIDAEDCARMVSFFILFYKGPYRSVKFSRT